MAQEAICSTKCDTTNELRQQFDGGHLLVAFSNWNTTPYHALGDELDSSNCGAADRINDVGKNTILRRLSFATVNAHLSSFVQEMYSKGMILANAIKQVRGLGDNKFEVVTSLRTFVFRAEREGRVSWLRY